MKLNIRYKILAGFGILLLIALAVPSISFITTQQYVLRQVSDSLHEKTLEAAEQISTLQTRIELGSQSVANEFLQSSGTDYNSVYSVITYNFQQNPYLHQISVLSPTGRELIRVDRFHRFASENLFFEIPTQPFFDAIQGKTGISKVYFLESHPPLSLVDIFTPIMSAKGEVIGVIKVQTRLDRLWDLLSKVKLGQQGYAYVVDDEGRLIAHPNSDLVLQAPNLTSRELIKQLLAQPPGQSLRDILYINENSQQYISTGVKISGFNWMVAVEQPTSEAYQPVANIRNSFIFTIILSLSILTLISLLISHHISSPIKALKQGAERLSAGELNARVNINTGDEIQELATSFNTMASQLTTVVTDLHSKIDLLEQQRYQLDQNATLLLRRDLDLREMNDQLEDQKETAISERNKLQLVLSGITDGVLAVDSQQKIILVNSAAEKIIGKLASSLIGVHLNDALQLFNETGETLPMEAYCPPITADKSNNIKEFENLKLIQQTGQTKFVNLVTGKMRGGLGINLGHILTFHDLTAEKELEKMKLDFVSMAAHELRTPLTTILGYLKFLQKEPTLTKLNSDENEYVENAFASALRLNKLIESLLVVSKIEQGNLNIHPHPTDLKQLIEKMLPEISGLTKTKNLEFKLKIPDQIPKVIGDEIPLEEVISNLVGNAVNYTTVGSISINIEVGTENVTLSVQDTGAGIPEHSLPHLFTKFFRAKGDLQAGPKGTGLGLYISKKIIDELHGEIGVHSQVSQGSTFFFSIPIAK